MASGFERDDDAARMNRAHEGCYTRTRSRVLSIVIWFGFAALVVISESQREDYERSAWTLVILAGPCILFGIRSFWFATVCASSDAFRYRGLFRNHVRRWHEIERFELREGAFSGKGGGDGAVPNYVSLVMVYLDESKHQTFRLGTLRWLGSQPNEEARKVASWLNDYVERYGRKVDAP